MTKNGKTHHANFADHEFGVNTLANYKYVYDAENVPARKGEQTYCSLSIIATG